MPGAFLTSDLDAIFRADEFATVATIGANSVIGIFSDETVMVEMEAGGQIAVQRVTFVLPDSNAYAVVNANIVIDSVMYRLTHAENDGGGINTWHLTRR